MDKPRYWSKGLRLSCALEHAVLRIKVFERPKTWKTGLFRIAKLVEEQPPIPDVEVENGLVLPPEDPLLVALDRIRRHQDDASAGNAVLQCWASLVEGNDTDNVDNSKEHRSSTSENEGDLVGKWPPKRDSLVVFEVFDGVLMMSDGLLREIGLVG